MMSTVSIRNATLADAERVAEIYNHYVLTTAISFEEVAVSASEMQSRMLKVTEAGLPWVVAEVDGQVVGYAYASKWRERPAYRFTVECTVYVAQTARGQGVGGALYDWLFPELKRLGYHAAVAGIALPNAQSVKLHERFGMRQVAHFSQVGYKFDRWHDVGTWQRIL